MEAGSVLAAILRDAALRAAPQDEVRDETADEFEIAAAATRAR
jgi:hypothetical protein